MIEFDINPSRYLYSPFKNLWKLDKYKEFKCPSKGLVMSKVKNYIILMYDIRSEIREQISDLGKQKAIAAEKAGFPLENNKFSPEVEDMLVGINENVNDMIVRYITLFNNPDYISYTASWELLYREIKKSMKSISLDSAELGKIRVNIEALRKTINELSASLFYGEDNIGLRKSLYKHMESEKIRLRPEHIATDISEGKLNLDVDPYKK